MHKIMYPDLFWLLNFVLDYEILRLESHLLRRKPRKHGLLVGACIGSVGICFLAFGPLKTPGRQIFAFLLVLLLQTGAFAAKDMREMLVNTLGFLMMGFLMAGILAFLWQNSWLGARVQVGKTVVAGAGEGGEKAALCWTAAGVFLCMTVTRLIGGISSFLFRNTEKTVQRFVTVTLFWKHRQWTLTGMVDSGNTLHAPWNGQAVHILSRSAAGELRDMPASEVRWIPYRSVGQAQGVLPAVTLDGIQIGEAYREQPIVAISRIPVSRDGRYQILLSEEECG